jgi:hypothetical protein
MATAELFKYNKFYTCTNSKSIQNFTIYGERHSGTNWLEKLISKTYSIPITWKYDHKHFFGCCSWEKLNDANHTLFIGIVRNIYNWIGGMKKIPYHVKSKDVLNIKPWRSEKGLSDYNKYCDSHWHTKEKYKDVFDMRSNKIEFLYLFMPYLVDNYVFIRYEDLIEHTDKILYTIEHTFNIKQKYENHICSDTSKLNLYRLSDMDMNTIDTNTKWLTENMIGYQKTTKNSTNYRISQEQTLDKTIPVV